MPHLFRLALTCTAILLASESIGQAQKTRTLLGMLAPWQYPDATMSDATMSDGATVNCDGQRTRPSIQCKTVLTTPDPAAKVVDYYKAKLQPAPGAHPATDKADQADLASGRSVMFHEDSDGRPLAVHVIVVNTNEATTTLVISRGQNEARTHIAWTHYLRL